MNESEGEKPTAKSLFEKLRRSVESTGEEVNKSRDELYRAQKDLTKRRWGIRFKRGETLSWSDNDDQQ